MLQEAIAAIPPEEDPPSGLECKICLTQKVQIAFQPCGHGE